MSQIAVARFKFHNFGAYYGERYVLDEAADSYDFKWQLCFGHGDETGQFCFRMTPLVGFGMSIIAHVSFVVRNKSGDVAYECSIPTQRYFPQDSPWHYNGLAIGQMKM